MSGFSHFRGLIANLPNFNENHWLFSQHRNGYSAAYRPHYPEKTAADFKSSTPTTATNGSWKCSTATTAASIEKFEISTEEAGQNPLLR